MAAFLQFQCRVPVGGYRITSFDERKWFELEEDPATDSVYPPDDLTDDERYLFERWGMRVVPGGDPEVHERELREVFVPTAVNVRGYNKLDFFATGVDDEGKVRRFNLFDEAATPFLDFANAPGTPEGAKALIDRFGPLNSGPQFFDQWFFAMMEMGSAVAAWEKARATGNFGQIIKKVERQARRTFEKHPESGIDASILLRKEPLTGKARLCVTPTSLEDALWTQLALAVDGSQSLRTCVECRSWFAIEADRGRSDKEYCSDACRMRAYRTRKSTALRKRR